MPTPRKNETEKEFISRAIPEIIKEGKTKEEATGKAYGLWRYYKNKGRKKMGKIINQLKSFSFSFNETINTDYKYHPVMEAGEMYSKIYKGILDADPSICELSDGPGKIEVHESFLQDVVDNFRAGVFETVPYTDVNHDHDFNCGNVVDCTLKDGKLFLAIDWNEKGKELIGQNGNGQYRYLSVDIGTHLNSQTGEYHYNVLRGVTLCNDPVYKDQKCIEMSEDSKKPAGEKLLDDVKINGGSKMQELFDALKKAIDEGNTEEAQKIIAQLESDMQPEGDVTDPEMEEGGMTEGENPVEPAEESEAELAGKKKKKMPNPAETQMSEKELKLSEKVSELNKRLFQAELKLSEKDFDANYVGKKIKPADKAAWFKLFCQDRKNTISILSTMPDLKLSGEFGTNQDINFKDMNPADADEKFTKAAIELSEKEKISFDVAVERYSKTPEGAQLLAARYK